MNILVVGASGATGRLLVEQLLIRDQKIKVVVRSPDSLPKVIKNHKNLSIIQASVLDLSDAEMEQHVKGCDAVASCLGHNITLKGLFGHPRRLVTDATSRLCNAIKANKSNNAVKFVLMNTIANSNRDIQEHNSIGHRLVIGLLRLILPPHVDNEKAADFLRTKIGQSNDKIEWTAVRPSGLINESKVTEYDVYSSPTGSAIFDSGKISRINVGHFMADLITENNIWDKWKGQMPVIYDKDSSD
jgi:putative NADH-flavin reductase